MSICTPQEQSTRGNAASTTLRGATDPDLVPRMFKPPEWEWFSFGDIGWWVRTGSSWSEILLGPDGLRLDEWRKDGRITTIKSGPHRVVYRAELPEGVIYIKHFLVPNRRAILRQWFRRGKGRNEGKRSRQLATIGVPTIWPIALGELRKRKFLFENYLVTPEIAEAVPLDEFAMVQLPRCPEPRRARVRQRLASALGVMTARLHDAGFLHEDFHPGNILVRFPIADEPELVMIDLDALRRRKQVELEGRQAEPCPARSFLLATEQPDRSVSLPGILPGESVGGSARDPRLRRADRGVDARLGRAPLEALGPAVPVDKQVFPDHF